MSVVEGLEKVIFDVGSLLYFPEPVLASITANLPSYGVTKLLLVGNRRLSYKLMNGGVESLKFRNFGSSSLSLLACFPRLLSLKYSITNPSFSAISEGNEVKKVLPRSLEEFSLSGRDFESLSLGSLSYFPNLLRLKILGNMRSDIRSELFVDGPPLIDLQIDTICLLSVIPLLPTSLRSLTIALKCDYHNQSQTIFATDRLQDLETLIVFTGEYLPIMQDFPPNLTKLHVTPLFGTYKTVLSSHEVQLPARVIDFRFKSYTSPLMDSFASSLPRSLQKLDISWSSFGNWDVESHLTTLARLPATISSLHLDSALLTPNAIPLLPPSLSELTCRFSEHAFTKDFLPSSLRKLTLPDIVNPSLGNISALPSGLTDLGVIHMTSDDIHRCWPSLDGGKEDFNLKNLKMFFQSTSLQLALPNLPKSLQNLTLFVKVHAKLSGIPRTLKTLTLSRRDEIAPPELEWYRNCPPPNWFDDIPSQYLQKLFFGRIPCPSSFLDRLHRDFPCLLDLTLTSPDTLLKITKSVPRTLTALSIRNVNPITQLKEAILNLPKNLESFIVDPISSFDTKPTFADAWIHLFPTSLTCITLPCDLAKDSKAKSFFAARA